MSLVRNAVKWIGNLLFGKSRDEPESVPLGEEASIRDSLLEEMLTLGVHEKQPTLD